MLSILMKGAELRIPWVYPKRRTGGLRGIVMWAAAGILALGAFQCAVAAAAPPVPPHVASAAAAATDSVRIVVMEAPATGL